MEKNRTGLGRQIKQCCKGSCSVKWGRRTGESSLRRWPLGRGSKKLGHCALKTAERMFPGKKTAGPEGAEAKHV